MNEQTQIEGRARTAAEPKSLLEDRRDYAVQALNLNRLIGCLRTAARCNRMASEEAQAALKLANEIGDEKLISACLHYLNTLILGTLDCPDIGTLELRSEELREAAYGVGGAKTPATDPVITSDFGDKVRTETKAAKSPVAA